MDMLQDLLGGQRRQEYDDFANRYDQGAPWDGISDSEAAQRYDEISPRLSDDEYRSSAAQAFERLSPQQRSEFGRWLNERSRDRGYPTPYGDDEFTDSNRLAEYTSRVRQEQPDLLGSLVGGMMGGGSGSGMGGGMMGGGMGGGGGLLSSPIAKAALGGIAATAFRSVMSRR